MSCYKKIKRVLEENKGVKVCQEGDYILIFKNNTLLTRYNLMFVEYSDNNLNGFIDYWTYKLKITRIKKKGMEVK